MQAVRSDRAVSNAFQTGGYDVWVVVRDEHR